MWDIVFLLLVFSMGKKCQWYAPTWPQLNSDIIVYDSGFLIKSFLYQMFQSLIWNICIWLLEDIKFYSTAWFFFFYVTSLLAM